MSRADTTFLEPVRLVIYDYEGTLGIILAEMLFDGIKPAVQTLEGRGITQAILSRRPDRRVLKAENLLSAFAKISTGKSLKHIQAIMKATGADPQRTISLGDSPEDMMLAKLAGVHPVGVSWDVGNSVEISLLKQAGAEHVLTDPSQIVPTFLEIFGLPAEAPPKPRPAPQPKGPWWRFGF